MNNTTQFYQETEHGDPRVRTNLDVAIPLDQQDEGAPSFAECRHAVLRVWVRNSSGSDTKGWVVYDRLLSRVVDGVYFVEDMALEVAAYCNTLVDDNGNSEEDLRSPNNIALDLIYPPKEAAQ